MNELTIAEIARYYGQKCLIEILMLSTDYKTYKKWVTESLEIDGSFLYKLTYWNKEFYRNIRILLKPLDSLTEEDAIEVLKRTGNEGRIPSDEARSEWGSTALQFFTQTDEWWIDHIDFIIGDIKLRNALHDLGYDVDGLIGRGLAVDVTKEGV